MSKRPLFSTPLHPEPPVPLSEVLNLWNMRFNTADIARMLGTRESVIYNMLARLARA